MIKEFYHEKLELNCKLDTDSGEIKVEDKRDPLFRTNSNYWMRYTYKETLLLKKSGGVDKQVHKLKKFFDGEIVENRSVKDLDFYAKYKR